jgi:hypothetical protein
VQLYFLEGTEASVDQTKGTLEVPGKGRFLTFDRRAGAESVPPGAGGVGVLSGSSRGSSLFDWNGSMSLTRASGALAMLGGVAMTHQRLADGLVLHVEGERLDAVLRGLDAVPTTGGAESAGGAGGELVSAEVAGAVFASTKLASGERQITADRLVFDSASDRLRVLANAGNDVSIFDVASGTPVRAAELLWDLGKDRIEVVRPSTLVTPR